jgi:hypothetical protein
MSNLTHLYCLLFPRRAARALGRAIADGQARKVMALMASGARFASYNLNDKVEPLLLAVSQQQKNGCYPKSVISVRQGAASERSSDRWRQ